MTLRSPLRCLSPFALLAAAAFAYGCSPPAPDATAGPGFVRVLRDVPGLKANQSVELYVPERVLRTRPAWVQLIVHFHGSHQVARQAVDAVDAPVMFVSVNLGLLSGPYREFFSDTTRFESLLAHAVRAADSAVNTGRPAPPVGFATAGGWTLTSFSAGYAAVREILKDRTTWGNVSTIVLADGLHADTAAVVAAGQMEGFVRFAREAAEGRRVMVVSHSSIRTTGYMSTTATAEWLLSAAGVTPIPAAGSDPIGVRISEAGEGGLVIRAYEGSTGPDHMRHFQRLGDLLGEALRLRANAGGR